jgi:hypothetical protein
MASEYAEVTKEGLGLIREIFGFIKDFKPDETGTSTIPTTPETNSILLKIVDTLDKILEEIKAMPKKVI